MKLFLLPLSIFLFMISFSVSAHDENKETPCMEKIKNENLTDLEAINKHLEWYGATNASIENAPCKTSASLSIDELNDYISKRAGKAKSSGVVNGVSFSNESPVLIAAFNQFTTAKDSRGFFPAKENQKNFQKLFSINPECKKVLCAINKIWGEGISQKMLYIFLKHNYNTSEYAFNDSDRFTSDELNDVMLGIEDMPKHLAPIGEPNQRLTHYSRGYGLKSNRDKDGEDRVNANSVVMLFDNWNKKSRAGRQYTVFHELSHNLSSKLGGMDESPSWLKLSSWVKKGDKWSRDEKACTASEYGLTNPWEDYAESLSAYRYSAKELKSNCPKKYEYLKKNVFKNVEYTSNESCSEIDSAKLQSSANDLNSSIQEKMNDIKMDMNVFKEKCSAHLSSYPMSMDDIDSCYAGLIKEQIDALGDDQLKIVLTKNNIKFDSNRLSQVKLAIAEKWTAAESSKNLDFYSNLKKSGDEFYTQMITESLPQMRDGKMQNFTFSMFSTDIDTNCREIFWSPDAEKRRLCIAETILASDKKWTEFGSSRYFKKLNISERMNEDMKKKLLEKYNEEIRNVLTKTDFLDPTIQKNADEMKKSSKQHFLMASRYLEIDRSDWKNMDSKDFCQKIYNKPSSYLVTYLLPKGSNGFPGFVDWCTAKEASKNQRFKLSENEIDEYISSRIK